MIKSRIYGLVLFLLMCVLSIGARGQTVRFNMDVQPELGVEVLQDLNFGTVITNSGAQHIPLGSARMGVFKIKALATQSAVLRLQKPNRLTSAQTDTTIPLHLDAAYSPESGNYQGAVPFANEYLKISLGNNAGSPTQQQVWENGYVYIFGTINVGNVPPGYYSGTLTLNVVYE